MGGLFAFEQDGCYPLRRIPMIMRFNLDECGIKLPLSAWVLLSRDEREMLISLPCVTNDDKASYRQRIIDLLQAHADNPDADIAFVAVDEHPVWRNRSIVPDQVSAQLRELGLPIPSIEQWRALRDLERFALVKLTRSGHKNANLIQALAEFGLT